MLTKNIQKQLQIFGNFLQQAEFDVLNWFSTVMKMCKNVSI